MGVGLDEPTEFPYFFVGTFIEAEVLSAYNHGRYEFPYFFVGTFIEAQIMNITCMRCGAQISLLFRRDFH